jgi:ketosteroid isomerase-like protein
MTIPRTTLLLSAAMAAGAMATTALAQPDLEALARQVADTERAFARTMAQRDHAAFAGFVSEQARFFGGGKVLRGRAEVAAGWRPFFDGPQAPFSWEPDQVEVLPDGTLALSTGPVRDPAGRLVGRFSSIWRQEAPGMWRVVFDRGEPPRPDER